MPSEQSEKVDLPQVQFLTVAEVAARMRVSKMTVYRLVHGGELPAARVGRSFRVPAARRRDHLRDAYVRRRLTAAAVPGRWVSVGAGTVGHRSTPGRRMSS